MIRLRGYSDGGFMGIFGWVLRVDIVFDILCGNLLLCFFRIIFNLG